jgi:hypothetical protein
VFARGEAHFVSLSLSRSLYNYYLRGARRGVCVMWRTSDLPWKSPRTEREQAISFLATAVGAMVLARAVDNPHLSKSILDAARRQLSETED